MKKVMFCRWVVSYLTKIYDGHHGLGTNTINSRMAPNSSLQLSKTTSHWQLGEHEKSVDVADKTKKIVKNL